jgi:mitogen-activated protein kinase kinase kinase
MLRHQPTLYTHAEREDSDDDVVDDDGWDGPASVPEHGAAFGGATPSMSRMRLHSRNSYSAGSPAASTPGPSVHTRGRTVPQYSDLYSQFVQRYRSGSTHDDPRLDTDSQFYQRALGAGGAGGGALPDADSEDEDLPPAVKGGDVVERLSGLRLDDAVEVTLPEPATLEQRERLEWQTMLASVLGGDVLKGEKTRIAGALESSAEEKNNLHVNLWLGLRARVHGRTEAEERKRIEERRVRTVDAALADIAAFRVADGADSSRALAEVRAVLARLDAAQALYPHLKALGADKPAALEGVFQARCDTLHTWSTVLTSLRKQIALLRKWTGSETLDVTQPNTDPEAPLGQHPARERTAPDRAHGDLPDGTTFVDRVLKEDSSQRTFEKGFLTTVHALIGTARDAQVNLAPWFAAMNLPTFEAELVPLISFPTRLVQAILRVRLDYVRKLKDPGPLIIEQIADDLRVNIGLACTLKRQYEAFLAPDPGGNWNLPNSIDADYDTVVLDALSFFFKLIHWKLKAGTKSIYFKETDILEGQWATFNDVSLSTVGGSRLVAEQLWYVTLFARFRVESDALPSSWLTNKLLTRVNSYFDSQIRLPGADDAPSQAQASLTGQTWPMFAEMGPGKRKKMNDAQTIAWYSRILDSGRLRHRRLHRFGRALAQRLCNSAEYDLSQTDTNALLATLVETDHFLVWTKEYMEDGIYVLASAVLREQPDKLRRLVTEAFHVEEVYGDEGTRLSNSGDPVPAGALDEDEDMAYVLLLSPTTGFFWPGLTVFLEIPRVELGLEDDRLRLVADGAGGRLELAKEQFAEVFEPLSDEEEPLADEDGEEESAQPVNGGGMRPPEMPECVIAQRAHLPTVARELKKIARSQNRLAELTVDSVHMVRKNVRGSQGYQELLELWYGFASEHGQHAQRYMDRGTLLKFNRLLIRLAISWVSFICDDCDPNDRKTFRWAVNALEFTLHRTRRNNILHLPDDQFELLRQKVASCMTLLISHFDILGARGTKEKERQEELLRMAALANARTRADSDEDEDDAPPRAASPSAAGSAPPADAFLADKAMRAFWERVSEGIAALEKARSEVGSEQHIVGRVLEDKPENRSLMFLAASSSNISIRWQQGRFIGAGAFGSVYLAVNLDSGSLMAVKEIRFQELSGAPNLISQIQGELSVMEMLHHPNVVEYYGMEVHRDKVYIFEEYCQGGSLAGVLEHGRIEDEGMIQVYTLQLLEGLAYLHSQGVVHRDIKPDSASCCPPLRGRAS